jgi:hypothetical protein
MPNTYVFGIHKNLSPVELFFFVAVDETLDELGVTDAVGVAMVLAGQRFIPTREKFAGAVKGTSLASIWSRRLLPYEIKHRILPTFTSFKSVVLLRIKMTKDIGAFVGRAIPGVGWMITAVDAARIMYRTVVKYNQLAKPEDRL